MSKLRAGLIGLGAMGRNHYRVLGGLPGVELVGVVDPDVASREPNRSGTPVYAELDQLLEVGVDYVTVACPTFLHEKVGLQLAEAGVHALIEKPLAHTVDGARALRDAFEARGLVGGVGHIERYNPALRNLKDRLAAGDLGEIHQIATRRQGPFPARISDVGVVKDLATHDIDLSSWVTQQDYTSVSAQVARRSGREHEDFVAVVASLSDGCIASHLINWLSPFKERQTVVTGERGAFIADTLTADLTFYANGAVSSEWDMVRSFRGVSEGDVTRFAISRREPLLVEHEHFRDAVLGISHDIVTFAQGLRVVEVSSAILESADTGLAVSTVA